MDASLSLTSGSLTSPQEQVLALISAGSTISQAAESAGVHRNTVHNWLNSQPAFRLALSNARRWKAIYWQEQAEELALRAIRTIRSTMQEPEVPAAIRLKAAQYILSLAMSPPAEGPATLRDLPPRPLVVESQPQAAPDPLTETVHNSAQLAPAEPETVHNSAQCPPVPDPVRPAGVRASASKSAPDVPALRVNGAFLRLPDGRSLSSSAQIRTGTADRNSGRPG